MAEPFIAEIKMFAGNFAPRNYAFCDGQILPIVQNSALFSLVGTTYGGNGRTDFGLPDLRGRFPMHKGTGAGLTPRNLGQKSGSETTSLNVNQLPAHSHTGHIVATASEGNSSDPSGKHLAATEEPSTPYNGEAGTVSMAAGSLQTDPTGANQTHDNMPPFQVISFIIALVGLFPSRN